MKKKNFTVLICICLFFLFIISGCNKPPEQDIGDAVSKSEDYYKKSKDIDCVGAFTDETVKFRLLLKEQPTDIEVTKLFNEILKTIEKYSNRTNTFDYYNAKLELAYKDTVIYTGTKDAGKKLIINAK